MLGGEGTASGNKESKSWEEGEGKSEGPKERAGGEAGEGSEGGSVDGVYTYGLVWEGCEGAVEETKVKSLGCPDEEKCPESTEGSLSGAAGEEGREGGQHRARHQNGREEGKAKAQEYLDKRGNEKLEHRREGYNCCKRLNPGGRGR